MFILRAYSQIRACLGTSLTKRVAEVRSRVPALVRRGARCCTTGTPCAWSVRASMSWQMGPLPWGYAAGACPFQISPISIPIPIPIGKLRWDMGKSRLKKCSRPSPCSARSRRTGRTAESTAGMPRTSRRWGMLLCAGAGAGAEKHGRGSWGSPATSPPIPTQGHRTTNSAGSRGAVMFLDPHLSSPDLKPLHTCHLHVRLNQMTPTAPLSRSPGSWRQALPCRLR